MGMQHVAAQASPIDRKTGLPQLGSEFCGLFMWGRGREGQLGVGSHEDNSVPKMVNELKGRRVLQVCVGQGPFVGITPEGILVTVLHWHLVKFVPACCTQLSLLSLFTSVCMCF